MAGVSTPAMAAAVSNAGALGSLGLGADTVETAARAISATRALTNRPLHLSLLPPTGGFESAHRTGMAQTARTGIRALWRRTAAQIREIYTSFLADPGMLRLLLDTKPQVVSFHFGLPPHLAIEALHEAGRLLIATATNLVEAKIITDAGLDAVIAQGYEAGGHRGLVDPDSRDDRLGTFALTRLLAAKLEIPVIAAGGIMDGAGIAAALRLGAAAAQLGTAFIGSPESSADADYRAALTGHAAHHTVMTNAISGRPARCLSNKFTALGENIVPEDIPAYPIAYDAGKSLHAAAKTKGNSASVRNGRDKARHLPAPCPPRNLLKPWSANSPKQNDYAAEERKLMHQLTLKGSAI